MSSCILLWAGDIKIAVKSFCFYMGLEKTILSY